MHEKLIELAKEKLGSHRGVARFLRVDESNYATYRRAKMLPPWMAGELAELVGENAEAVEAEAHIEIARSEPEREHYRRRLQRCRGMAATVLVALILILLPPSAEAASMIKPSGQNLNTSSLSIHYTQ